jgi:putative solute:sodium symporter small subunit
MDEDQRRSYWRANTALIRNLLIVWALVSLVFWRPLWLLDGATRINLGICSLDFHLCLSNGQARP